MLGIAPVTIMRGTATPGRDVTQPECFGRFTVVALYGGAIRGAWHASPKCAGTSHANSLDQQEARA